MLNEPMHDSLGHYNTLLVGLVASAYAATPSLHRAGQHAYGVLEHEQGREDVDDGRAMTGLAGDQLGEGVADEADGDARGDREREGHPTQASSHLYFPSSRYVNSLPTLTQTPRG